MPLGPSSRPADATTLARINTATTTPIAAGALSYTVIVITAASAASPTLDGVALPLGEFTFGTDGSGTLDAASLVTVAGDDVLLMQVR